MNNSQRLSSSHIPGAIAKPAGTPLNRPAISNKAPATAAMPLSQNKAALRPNAPSGQRPMPPPLTTSTTVTKRAQPATPAMPLQKTTVMPPLPNNAVKRTPSGFAPAINPVPQTQKMPASINKISSMPTQRMPAAPAGTPKYPGLKQPAIPARPGSIGAARPLPRQPLPQPASPAGRNNPGKANPYKKGAPAPIEGKEPAFSKSGQLKTSSRDLTLWIFAAVGIIVILGSIYLVFSSKAEKKHVKMLEEAENVLTKALNLAKNNDFKGALSIYDKFLDDDRFKEYPGREKVEELVKNIKHRMEREAGAKTKVDGLVAKVKKADKAEYADLEKELIAFIAEYGETTSALVAKQEVDNIRNSRKDEKKQSAAELFQTIQMDADKLESEGQPEKALEKWRKFYSDYPEASVILQKRINKEIVRLKQLIEKNKK